MKTKTNLLKKETHPRQFAMSVLGALVMSFCVPVYAQQSESALSEENLTDAELQALSDAELKALEESGEDVIFIDDEEAKLAGIEEGDTIQIELEELIVIGSNIRGVNPTSNIYLFDQDDITSSGYNSVEDFLRQLPQNQGTIDPGITRTVDGGNFGRRAINNRSSGINLRGLGESASLVLVNGRRISASASGVGGFADVSSIPLAAVDVIEVLTDGASAIYGADAVGGVVNIKLKDNYQGGITQVRVGSSSTGGDDVSFNQTLGLTRGKFNSLFTFGYEKEKAVPSQKYGLTSVDFTDRGFGNQGFEGAGSPGVVTPEDLFLGFIDFPFAERIAFPNVQAGETASLDNAIENGAGNATGIPLNLGPQFESFSFTSSMSYALTDVTELDATIIYDQRLTETVGAPFIFTDVEVPANNPFSPFRGDDFFSPEDVFVSYSTDGEVARGIIEREQDEDKTTSVAIGLGFEHQFGNGAWRVRGDLNYSENEINTQFREVDIDAVNAVAVLSDPARALNVFSDGSGSDAATFANFLTPKRRIIQNSETIQASLVLDGELFQIAGGPVAIATGLDYRTEDFNFRRFGLIDPDTGKGNSEACLAEPEFCPGGEFDTFTDRDAISVFSEINAPLIGEDNALPFVESLTLSGAARYERYEDTEVRDNVSPSIGLRWVTGDFLTLRANYNESFRTPALDELTDSNTVFRDSGIFDSNIGQTVTVDQLIFGGNPDLDNETAETFSFGVEFNVADVFVDLNYFSTTFNDKIEQISEAFLNVILADSDRFPSLITRNPDGSIARLNQIPINIGRVEAEGLDFRIERTFEFNSAQNLKLLLSGTRNFTAEQENIEGVSGLEDILATDFGPQKMRVRAESKYQYKNLQASLFANYNSGYNYRATDNSNDSFQAFAKSYTTWDAQLQYQFEQTTGPLSGMSLALGATNIFDEEPPFYGVGLGVLFFNGVDPRGRVIYLDLTKEF